MDAYQRAHRRLLCISALISLTSAAFFQNHHYHGKITQPSSLSKSKGSAGKPLTPLPIQSPAFSTARHMRVAYQGEPGAYSEKSTRELLGSKVVAIGRPNFEACFQAVASMEVDYACLPIENSLGGSIHENYDLMLRYDLTIVAEHDFRVEHCLLAKEGVAIDEIKYAISHPQALAQCDNYLRSLGITPIPTYDTAGSAKMIKEDNLPAMCTPENTAAVASDLAGTTYGLNCLNAGIEDDDSNFTRFLLLSRKGVAQHLTKKIPAKTSIVFTLPNAAGALYKALACFSLRDIDFTKIESRPTSANLLNFLKFQNQQNGRKSRSDSLPRFRYCFYLDFLGAQLDENSENALAHLREQADFVRLLGSYPQKSALVGPVAKASDELKNTVATQEELSLISLPSDTADEEPLKIGVVGFGPFAQYLTARLSTKHTVRATDKADMSAEARQLGIDFIPAYDMSSFVLGLDVVIMAVPMVEFEESLNGLPVEELRGKLVVDVCPLSVYPKDVMLRKFGDHPDIDILSTHPMLTPSSRTGTNGVLANDDSWDDCPVVYEKVRVLDILRVDRFLKFFEQAHCRMVEMEASEHDASIANAEFVTHLTGRLLDRDLLPPTPVVSKEYAALCDVADMTSDDDFDLFFGMYKYNDSGRELLNKMRDNLAALERELAAREAYLAAKSEMLNSDRQRLLAETRLLLQEIAKNGQPTDQLVSSLLGATGPAEAAKDTTNIEETP